MTLPAPGPTGRFPLPYSGREFAACRYGSSSRLGRLALDPGPTSEWNKTDRSLQQVTNHHLAMVGSAEQGPGSVRGTLAFGPL